MIYFHASPFSTLDASGDVTYWRPNAPVDIARPVDIASHPTADGAKNEAYDRAVRYGRSMAVIETTRYGQRVIGWYRKSGRWVGR